MECIDEQVTSGAKPDSILPEFSRRFPGACLGVAPPRARTLVDSLSAISGGLLSGPLTCQHFLIPLLTEDQRKPLGRESRGPAISLWLTRER